MLLLFPKNCKTPGDRQERLYDMGAILLIRASYSIHLGGWAVKRTSNPWEVYSWPYGKARGDMVNMVNIRERSTA